MATEKVTGFTRERVLSFLGFEGAQWFDREGEGPCGLTWRPALVHTVGVDALPGFLNEPFMESK